MHNAPTEKKPHVFLFWGENSFGIDEKVAFWKKEFTKKHGLNGLWASDASDMPDPEAFTRTLRVALRSASLFGSSKLTIIKSSEKLPSTSVDLLLSLLPGIEQNHFIVLVFGKIEKKQEVFKKLAELGKKGTLMMEEFKIPTGARLVAWTEQKLKQHGAAVSGHIVDLFLATLGQCDMARIDSEITKLCSYAKDKKITKEDICAITSSETDVRIFDLSDAILKKNTLNALRLSDVLFYAQQGNAKQAILGGLAYLKSEIRGLALLSGALASGESAKAEKLLGWSPQRIWIAKKKMHSRSFEEFLSIYKKLIYCEWDLKRSSLNPRGIFDVLLWKTVK